MIRSDATMSVVSFGPYDVIESQRIIMMNGLVLDLSPRCFDVLLALLAKPNELVTKAELLANVWSGLAVEEGTLRFHIAGLRKALGDGRDGARYIGTVPGRGYWFVAHVEWSERAFDATAPIDRGSGRVI